MNPRPPDESEGMFEGLRGGPILIGALLDLIVTQLASSVVELGLAPGLLSPDEATRRALVVGLMASPAYLTAKIAVGALGTVIGAFVGARQAGQLFVRHGGWIAVTSTVLGTFASILLPSPPDLNLAPPLWAEAASVLLILPSGVAGGALAGWLQRRQRP